MRQFAFVAALSVSLLAPAARADDYPADQRQRALEARERHQDEREQSLNQRAHRSQRDEQRALRDDQRDLARVESLAARLQTMRTARPPRWAVVALDTDVQRELASERLEGQQELQRDTAAAQSSHAAMDRRQGPGGERRGDDGRGGHAQRVEAAQGQRLEHLRQEYANLNGQYGRAGMERRQVLLAEFVALARQELAGDRRNLQSAR